MHVEITQHFIKLLDILNGIGAVCAVVVYIPFIKRIGCFKWIKFLPAEGRAGCVTGLLLCLLLRPSRLRNGLPGLRRSLHGVRCLDGGFRPLRMIFFQNRIEKRKSACRYDCILIGADTFHACCGQRNVNEKTRLWRQADFSD